MHEKHRYYHERPGDKSSYLSKIELAVNIFSEEKKTDVEILIIFIRIDLEHPAERQTGFDV